MVVKVISAAPDPSVVRNVICSNCGSKLEFVPADIKSRSVRDYTGGSDDVHSINCPTCSHEIFVAKYGR